MNRCLQFQSRQGTCPTAGWKVCLLFLTWCWCTVSDGFACISQRMNKYDYRDETWLLFYTAERWITLFWLRANHIVSQQQSFLPEKAIVTDLCDALKRQIRYFALGTGVSHTQKPLSELRSPLTGLRQMLWQSTTPAERHLRIFHFGHQIFTKIFDSAVSSITIPIGSAVSSITMAPYLCGN